MNVAARSTLTIVRDLRCPPLVNQIPCLEKLLKRVLPNQFTTRRLVNLFRAGTPAARNLWARTSRPVQRSQPSDRVHNCVARFVSCANLLGTVGRHSS